MSKVVIESVPIDRATKDAIFCGVWPGTSAGHHAYAPGGRRADHPVLDVIGSWDGVFAPNGFHWVEDRRLLTSGQYPSDDQPEGVWLHVYLRFLDPKWTLIALWDRSEDGRGGSNSNFFLQMSGDSRTPADSMALAREVFPEVFERIDRHLVAQRIAWKFLWGAAINTPDELYAARLDYAQQAQRARWT